jgi:hypothetical protein
MTYRELLPYVKRGNALSLLGTLHDLSQEEVRGITEKINAMLAMPAMALHVFSVLLEANIPTSLEKDVDSKPYMYCAANTAQDKVVSALIQNAGLMMRGTYGAEHSYKIYY